MKMPVNKATVDTTEEQRLTTIIKAEMNFVLRKNPSQWKNGTFSQ